MPIDNDARSKTGVAHPLVLLCTYNEIENLPTLVTTIWNALPAAHILVIDDNSPDGTGAWVREHEAIERRLFLVRRAGKQGLGTALKAGICWTLERDYDYLINMDADLSHPPSVLPELLAACQSQPATDQAGTTQSNTDKATPTNTNLVAVGSRYIPGGGFEGLPFYRRWMSRALNAYARRTLHIPLSDCSGSLRCYGREALQQVKLDELKCEGYGFLEEIVVYLHRAGVHFNEVPYVFSARAGGHSKLSFGDALGALAVIHRLGKSSMIER